MVDMLRELRSAIQGGNNAKSRQLVQECIKLAPIPVEGDGWISVEASLPQNNTDVDLWSPHWDDEPFIGWHQSNGWWVDPKDEAPRCLSIEGCDPSHWRPRPGPPKSTTDNTEKR